MKGSWAEDAALRYLLDKGYELIGRNRRAPYGELDLWMKDGEAYVAVEVKQRRGERFGTPLEAITPKKIERMQASAIHLLERDDVSVRLEAVLVYGSERNHRIDHQALED